MLLLLSLLTGAYVSNVVGRRRCGQDETLTPRADIALIGS